MSKQQQQSVKVFGADGMIGSAVCTYFDQRCWHVERVTRAKLNIVRAYSSNMLYDEVEILVSNADAVINCINTTSEKDGMIVNSIFPAVLARACKAFKVKMIHVTTDELYKPYAQGEYTSKHFPTTPDTIGMTRWVGERAVVAEGGSVLRASVMGDWAPNHESLPQTIKSFVRGATVEVDDFYFWNGMTTHTLASILHSTLSAGGTLWEGTRTFASAETVSRVKLFEMLAKVYNREDLKIVPTEGGATTTHRTLSPDEGCVINTSLLEQIKSMKNDAPTKRRHTNIDTTCFKCAVPLVVRFESDPNKNMCSWCGNTFCNLCNDDCIPACTLCGFRACRKCDDTILTEGRCIECL